MTYVEQLAEFIVKASFEEISDEARQQLKVRVLDSLGCAIGALRGEPILLIGKHLQDFGGSHHCTLIGGGRTSPDRAAFFNSALVRYLDFNDSYLAKGETCHPSDNLGAILAASEYANGSGMDLLVALAVAYQVQCRLSDEAPVRAKGFDHVTQGAYAVAAGVSKALGLDSEKTAHAIAISGTALNALRVTRTGRLSHWKGLAYPNTAFGGTHATFLAMRGVTGPLEVFEGNKGFMDTIAGDFTIDWSKEDLERVRRTILKKYNAEIHSQSVIEGLLELKQEHAVQTGEIDRLDIEIFDVAYHIIGGGEEGSKKEVSTKEEADHSLPYIAAVALIDGWVGPEQYQEERILREDVQQLLKRVVVQPSETYSRLFPEQMPCRLTLKLKDGRTLIKEKQDYQGFFSRPMTWEQVVDKFEQLSEPYTDTDLRRQIISTVSGLEHVSTAELTGLLSQIR